MRSRPFIFVILIVILFCSGAAHAQKSAYSLAKDLYNYGRSDTATSIDEQKEVLANLAWYARAADIKEVWNKLLQSGSSYGTLRNYSLKLYDSLTEVNQIFEFSQKQIDTIFGGRYQHLKRELEAINTTKTALSKLEDGKLRTGVALHFANFKIDSLKKQLQLKEDSLPQPDSIVLRERLLLDTVNIQAVLRTWGEKRDSLQNVDTTLAAGIRTSSENIEQKKKDFIALLYTPDNASFRIKHFGKNINSASLEIMVNRQMEVIRTQVIAYGNQKQDSPEQAVIPLSFRMPSQTEMIDALAIYLAKRVKQETVLWFFETIRKNAEVNTLIRDCFPETVKLLESGAVYETPNMGAAWRYALSKDFITFPENAFKSKWLLKHIPADKQYLLKDLQTGVTIARLIAQQYSYNDIVRYLYMEQNSPVSAATDSSMIRHTITLLYAIQQELKVLQPTLPKDYRLTYEDMLNMPNELFVMMLELIDFRYQQCITGILGENIGATQPQKVEAIRNWLGRIQLTVYQINKAREEFNTAVKSWHGEEGKKDVAFSHYSVWKFLSELMKTVVPDSSLSKMSALQRESFRYLAQAQEVYEQLEKKNYSGAIGTTFGILDSIAGLEKISDDWKLSLKDINIQYLVENGIADDVNKKFIFLNKQWMTAYQQVLGSLTDSMNNELRQKIYLGRASSTYNGKDIKIDPADSISITFHQQGKVTVNSPSSHSWRITPGLTLDFERNPREFSTIQDFNQFILNAVTASSNWEDRFLQQLNNEKINTQYTLYRKGYYEVRDAVVRLASFLNDVALAGDSKQLARVIESYAMPPGSYKRKRNVWYSVDLNAFVGAYGGYEFPLRTFGNSASGQNGWVYGISAPIGITWSRSRKKSTEAADVRHPGNIKSNKKGFFKPSGGTFSMTLSILDPGAVVSYRFTKTENVAPQEFKWDQIISPGLHFGYAIKGTPLVVNTGAVYTPQLRSITNAVQEGPAAVNRQLNTIRLYAGIFFDIPLLNLWEKKSITRYSKYRRKDLQLTPKLAL